MDKRLSDALSNLRTVKNTLIARGDVDLARSVGDAIARIENEGMVKPPAQSISVSGGIKSEEDIGLFGG